MRASGRGAARCALLRLAYLETKYDRRIGIALVIAAGMGLFAALRPML